MQYYVDCCDPSRGETYWPGKSLAKNLSTKCREALWTAYIIQRWYSNFCWTSLLLSLALIHTVTFPTGPRTEVTAQGDVVYSEVVRECIRKLEAFVEEMATGGRPPTAVHIDKVHEDVLKLLERRQVTAQEQMKDVRIFRLSPCPISILSCASHLTR